MTPISNYERRMFHQLGLLNIKSGIRKLATSKIKFFLDNSQRSLAINYSHKEIYLNPNLGGLFRGLFWGGRGIKLPSPYLKIIRIKLETWNLVCKHTHVFNFRKYTFQYQDTLNFADVSKKINIFGKIVNLLKVIVRELS